MLAASTSDLSWLIHQSKTPTHSLFPFPWITSWLHTFWDFVGMHVTTRISFHLEYAQLFATLIARTAKDVDVLIDSLPSEESTSALQVTRGEERREGRGVAFNHQCRWFSLFLKGFTSTEALVAPLAFGQQGELCEQLYSSFISQFISVSH